MRTEAREGLAVTPAPAAPVPHHRYALFGAIVAAGLVLDLGSKHWVFAELGCPGQAGWQWRLGDVVRFTLHTNFNRGALWGFGQGWTGAFAGLSIAAVVGILYFLFRLKYARSKWLTVALAFVMAGALGNLYDRLGMHGWRDATGQPIYAVRDFLYFRFFESFDWAIFNFADSMLVTGAIMLVIHSFCFTAAADPAAPARAAA